MAYTNAAEPLIPVGSVRTTLTYDMTGKLRFMWEQKRDNSLASSGYPFRVTVFHVPVGDPPSYIDDAESGPTPIEG